MGAWGTGPFENDDAADWVIGLIDRDDIDEIAITLEVVAESEGETISILPCCCAVAAAEVVSAARGYPCSGFPPELKTWTGNHAFYADRALTTTAKAAVRRILAGSELAAEWDGHSGWKRRMNNLAKRLGQPSKAKRSTTRKAAPSSSAVDNATLIKTLRGLGGSVYKTPDGEIEGVDLSDSRVARSDLPMIMGIPKLTYLAIYFDGFGDSDLKKLSKLRDLTDIAVLGPDITDEGLKHLATMANLREVSINCKEITDEGLKHLTAISKLEKLDLCGCEKITDAGIRGVKKLAALKLLKVWRTGVTKSAADALRKAMPKCDIRMFG